jgi:hypothetical protein
VADRTIRIPEDRVPGKPLGRHVRHDPRSLAFTLIPPLSLGDLVDVLHARRVPIFTQTAGSCTGESLVGALGTEPFYSLLRALVPDLVLDHSLAVEVYSAATLIDQWDGSYPPTDTGSDGLSVAKVAHRRAWVAGYRHATTLGAALLEVQSHPILTGVSWWSSFDDPDSSGLVEIASSAHIRGGHEVVVLGCDVTRKRVRCANSWGTDYGDRGYFDWSWDTYGRLLDDAGDATALVPMPAPPDDDDIAARIAASARRRGMQVAEWLDLHFRRYFRI